MPWVLKFQLYNGGKNYICGVGKPRLFEPPESARVYGNALKEKNLIKRYVVLEVSKTYRPSLKLQDPGIGKIRQQAKSRPTQVRRSPAVQSNRRARPRQAPRPANAPPKKKSTNPLVLVGYNLNAGKRERRQRLYHALQTTGAIGLRKALNTLEVRLHSSPKLRSRLVSDIKAFRKARLI